MSDSAAKSSSYTSYFYNLGASALQYGYDTVASYVNYDGGDLDVIDPNAQGAENVTQIDENDQRQSYFMSTNFSKYIGMDVMSLMSVPVWIMEPMSVTQRLAEIMEYTDILDKAADCQDPMLRHAYITAYLVTPYGCVERTYKPFNPILGETFEYSEEDKYRFFAEQVSHHPPISAAHAFNDKWDYDIVSAPKTKFLGNSVEVYPISRTRIHLKEAGETYGVVPAHVKAHNIVVGRSWIDVFGPMEVHCAETGTRAEITFTPCGWFGSGRYTLSGHVIDKDGTKVMAVSGKWNSHVDAVRCGPDGEPSEGVEPLRLWTCSPKPENTDGYSFTDFAHKLNTVPSGAPTPLMSDSRRRLDRSALAAGDSVVAQEQKHALEERQRAEKRERTKRGDAWTPRWFETVPEAERTSFPWEVTDEEMDHWRHKPEAFTDQDKRSPCASNSAVDGKEFCPWQYPELPTGEAA